MSYQRLLSAVCALALLSASSLTSHAAGGEVTGAVVDTKGAVVVGAAITVIDPVSNRSFTSVSDAQGRYKVSGLPPGTYVVTITANGFSDARRENVEVDDSKGATVDVRLEVARLDAGTVTVSASGRKPNADPAYQQLRRQASSSSAGDFTVPVASINSLMLKRDAAIFTLRSGELYFLAPVEGRMTGAVFIGDGEMTLTPPIENERRHLAIFTKEPTLTESFTQLVLRFTDKTFDEVKASAGVSMRQDGAQSGRARDIFRDHQDLLRRRLRGGNVELRILADIYAPQRPGFFTAFIGGRRFNKLIYLLDPLGIPDVTPEEVALFSYGETDYGFWSAFRLAGSYREGVSQFKDQRLIDIAHHEIDAAIRGTQLAASDRLTFRVLAPGVRVLPFDLFRSLRVSRVQDEQGRDLDFVQESKNEDAEFGVIFPESLEAGKTYKLMVQYTGGDAIRDSGGGNFMLLPRSSWYPTNGSTQFGVDRARFDMTFRYPKGNTFIGTGMLAAPELHEGDLKVSKWSSGNVELAVAGFNYGRFNKKELTDKATGYALEFYANEEVPDELRAYQLAIEEAERQGQTTTTTLGSVSTTKAADASLADAQNSTRIYNAYFGKLPYSRLAMTQQPAGNFGQAWPTLVYMPYTAFINTTQLRQMIGSSASTNSFWKYVGPHELAHQWWGHTIGWKSYRDQWMSEGFAEFSASLYVQYVRKDLAKFTDFWEEQRKQITEATPRTKGLRPYTVGSVTQGFRLSGPKTGATYQNLVYPKGAYILHMLRMMMFGASGDKQFQLMMKDFVKTHFNKDVSTEDFKRAAEKYMTAEMNLDNNRQLDWFFNQWVYGTEVPSYRFDYQLSGSALSGSITQSGVSENFRMIVPVYVDYGNGWETLGSVTVAGSKPLNLNLQLPKPAKRAALCVLNDVLAVNIENNNK